MINFLVTLAIGIFLGWVVIPQPAWAQSVYDKITTTVKGWFNKE